jgi:hypothetical protein
MLIDEAQALEIATRLAASGGWATGSAYAIRWRDCCIPPSIYGGGFGSDPSNARTPATDRGDYWVIYFPSHPPGPLMLVQSYVIVLHPETGGVVYIGGALDEG